MQTALVWGECKVGLREKKVFIFPSKVTELWRRRVTGGERGRRESRRSRRRSKTYERNERKRNRRNVFGKQFCPVLNSTLFARLITYYFCLWNGFLEWKKMFCFVLKRIIVKLKMKVTFWCHTCVIRSFLCWIFFKKSFMEKEKSFVRLSFRLSVSLSVFNLFLIRRNNSSELHLKFSKRTRLNFCFGLC